MSNIRYFYHLTLINLKFIIRKATPILLCLALIAFAIAGVALTGKKTEKLSLAIYLQDTDPMAKMAVNMMSNADIIRENIQISIIEKEEEIYNYDCAVKIPQGFINGVLTGENPSPTLIINRETTPFEEMFLTELARSLERYLKVAQGAIYVGVDSAIARGYEKQQIDNLVYDTNVAAIELFLNRENFVKQQHLSIFQAGGMERHIETGIIIFLTITAAILAAGAASNSKKASQLTGKQVWFSMSSGLMSIYIYVLCTTIGTAWLLKAEISFFSIVLAALVASLLGTTVGTLVSNRDGQLIFGMSVNVLGSIVAGIIIPTLLLPESFGLIATVTPSYYVKLSLEGKLPGLKLMGVIAFSLVLIVITLISARRDANEK